MTLYLLRTNKIELSNIKYKLLSTLTVSHDYFKEFLNYIIANFGNKFAKLGPNALVGVFNKRCTTRTKLHMTNSYKQAVTQFFESPNKNVIFDKDVGLYCIFENNDIEYDETRAPLYKYVVEQELIEMDMLKTQIENAGGLIVRYNTDCISAYFKNDTAIKQIVDNTYWDKEKQLPKYKFEVKEHFDLFVPKMANYNRSEKTTFDLNREWKTIDDNDDFDALVKQIIDSKQSLMINGRAGCGKSTLINKIKEKLADNSYITLAPTNKASIIVHGQTIHRFLAGAFNNKKSLCKKLEGVEYIFVDEISMVKELFYKVFLSIKRLHPNIKFILVGDFNQLLPVNDRHEYDYANSPAIFELCDCNKLELTKCRRADDIMFNLCNPETVHEIDIKQFGNKFTERHLSFTNKKRIEINDKCMKQFKNQAMEKAKRLKKKSPAIVSLKKLDYDKNSQDVELLAGMPIIARVNNKLYNISNNETLKIVSVDSTRIRVRSDMTDEIKEIGLNEFQALFYLAFCITVHKSQGCTFNYPYTINEWNLFDWRLKYVALSRATKKEYINIV